MTNKHELKRKQLKYEAMDTTKKTEVLNKKAEEYKTMSTATKKHDFLNEKAEQYKTMDTVKRQDLLKKKVEQYKTMDTAKKLDLLNKKAEQFCDCYDSQWLKRESFT